MTTGRDVYIVNYSRTPFLKSRNVPGPFAASDLAVTAGRQLLLSQGVAPTELDEVILGCMMPSENEANIGRLVALRMGCGDYVPGWTVQRNCASGMQALDSAYKDIQLGRANLVLAGGTETMSRAPLIFKEAAVLWFARLQKSKSAAAKLATLARLKPKNFTPIIALLKGLTDPYCGMTMPQTAEQLAYEFGITREEMDLYSLHSHERATAAQNNHYFPEIVDLYDAKEKVYDVDTGVRSDTSLERLASLRSFVDKRFGMVTAGNSSQVTDGASVMLLASEDALSKYNLKPVGKIKDVEWAGLRPDIMGLGPVMASVPLLMRNQLTMKDVSTWEINEAFAAQVLACTKAFADKDFCSNHFDLDEAFGEIDFANLNVDGGAIAMGHPVGASGARIVARLLSILHRRNERTGVAAICIGGGQGGAMLIEALQ